MSSLNGSKHQSIKSPLLDFADESDLGIPGTANMVEAQGTVPSRGQTGAQAEIVKPGSPSTDARGQSRPTNQQRARGLLQFTTLEDIRYNFAISTLSCVYLNHDGSDANTILEIFDAASKYTYLLAGNQVPLISSQMAAAPLLRSEAGVNDGERFTPCHWWWFDPFAIEMIFAKDMNVYVKLRNIHELIFIADSASQKEAADDADELALSWNRMLQ